MTRDYTKTDLTAIDFEGSRLYWDGTDENDCEHCTETSGYTKGSEFLGGEESTSFSAKICIAQFLWL